MRKFLVFLIVAVSLGVLGYAAYQFKLLASENSLLRLKIEQSQVVAETQSEINLSVPEVPTSSELNSIEARSESTDSVISDSVAVLPVTPQITQADVDDAVERALSNKQTESVAVESAVVPLPPVASEIGAAAPSALIEVVRVTQTAYPDDYGGVYGAYGLTLSITAQGSDVLVPLTTSDTLGTGLIGLSYSAVGGTFKGKQESDIDGCMVRVENFCKFKAGQTRELTVTAWLTPNAEGDGNYSVRFNRLKYYIGDEEYTHEIGRETEPLNIYY